MFWVSYCNWMRFRFGMNKQVSLQRLNQSQFIGMFDFLNKPTHHHPPQQKPKPQHEQVSKTIEQTKRISPSMQSLHISVNPSLIPLISTRNNKKPSRVKQYQQNSQLHLSPEVQNQLKQMLCSSQDLVKDVNAIEIIRKEMQIMEKRAFTRYTAIDQIDYLQKLFGKTPIANNFVKQSLDDLINGTANSIADDIQNNFHNYEVFRKQLQKVMTKQQMQQAQTVNQLNAIKLKEGLISSKVGQLKMELNIIEEKKVITKAKQIIQKDTFGKDNQKTKQAEKFIENKKLLRQQLQRKKKQEQLRKKQKQLQEKILQQKQAQKAKSQKHAKLIQKFQAKLVQKQKRKHQIQTDKQKFNRFIKQYKKAKPLYQQKIQQQIQRQIQYKRQRFQQMNNRKNIYNPISFQQIQSFESKYLQLKRQLQQKKNIQMAIRKDEEKFRIQQMRQKNYKGKYRYLVLEEMVNRQAKVKQEDFVKKLLVEKKRAYSVDIKDKFKPKIDQHKRIESLKFVAHTQRKLKQKGPRRVRLDSSDSNNFNTISYETQQQQQLPDPRKQGQKYRRLLKQYISQKIQKGEIKRPQTLQSQLSAPTPKINYLKEQRQHRQARGTINSSFSYQSLDAQSRIKKIRDQVHGDMGMFKMRAQELDEKAKRQQLKLKYSEHTPNDEKQLEENYLASIKAKLQLLNHVK